jgi:uncharacterized membrane protein
MAKPPRRKSKARAVKASTALMPMSLTAGLFLGFGLGALASSVLWMTLAGLAVGAAVGYHVDKRNGIAYTRGKISRR